LADMRHVVNVVNRSCDIKFFHIDANLTNKYEINEMQLIFSIVC
jgi:hypothetical protein